MPSLIVGFVIAGRTKFNIKLNSNHKLSKTQIFLPITAKFKKLPKVMESGLGNSSLNQKREGYLSWENYFMGIAMLSAMRSKDPCTQVGACIVNKKNRIVGMGYNGMPNDCSDEKFPWRKDAKKESENKHMYVCHAEMNAILNNIGGQLDGCTIYVTLFPCSECAKLIIQSGIKEIVYLSNKNWNKETCVASRNMFDNSEVKVIHRQFKPDNESKPIVIDFKSTEGNQNQ